jgi:glycine/D-amino acid oxidase-like deaminating enzyme
MAEPFPLSPALWAATAPPALSTPPLGQSGSADVCVVGAGYAGLSTALHLAERGTKVVVLEAYEPGWGGSGRNGGQVIPGLKYDPDQIEALFGPEAGPRIVNFAGRTADIVFDLIAKHKMAVPHARNGWIQPAHTAEAIETVRKRAEQWARRGADVSFLDGIETERHLGTAQYKAGWIDRRGGAVQPLAFARELARAAIGAGAAVHGASRVSRLSRKDGRWQVKTEHGPEITAERVVLCTNGYTGDLVPKLRQTIIAPNSFQIATAPLSDNVRSSILPYGQVCSDTRKLLLYFRLDHTGRFLLGGRGPFREPTGPSDWGHLDRILGKLFPQLTGAPIEFRWCGRVALTRDFLPHLHEPEPGLLIDIGCMGRGVGLQTAMGAAIADYIATGRRQSLPFPVVPIRPLPLHRFHQAYVSAIIAWYRLTDGGVKAASPKA